MKKLAQKMYFGAFAGLVALSPNIAFAVNNAGDTAKQIGEQASSITVAAVLIATLLGIIALIVSGLTFKKHGDNPQQVPLSKPLIYLAAGTLLFGLGATSDVMQQTIFGGGRIQDSNGGFKTFE